MPIIRSNARIDQIDAGRSLRGNEWSLLAYTVRRGPGNDRWSGARTSTTFFSAGLVPRARPPVR